MPLNLSDEAIQKILAETAQNTLDDMLYKILVGSDYERTTASGVSYVDWSNKARETYTEAPTGHYGQPGYCVTRKEKVVDYTVPASALEIEGEFTVVEEPTALVVKK